MKNLSRLSICLLAASAMVAPESVYAQSVDDEVIAVGTLIKRKAQADRISPVVTFDASDIDSVGAKSIADLTQTLTINTGSENCLLYTSPSPRDATLSRMPSSA